MPQPVKLSDELINAARATAALSHRSLAGQIEHWAGLGRAIEKSLTTDQSTLLKRSVREPAPTYAVPAASIGDALAQTLAHALSPAGTIEARAYLDSSAAPLYGTDPDAPGLIVRRNPDGTRTLGTWKDGDFQPVGLPEAATARSSRSAASRTRSKVRRVR